jgi:hypothetical protein
MLNVVIYDRTGKESGKFRRDILRLRFLGLGVKSKEWGEYEVQDPPNDETILLVHFTNLSPVLEARLRAIASSGAVVVRYGAGSVQERWEKAGRGEVFVMGWQILQQVLDQLPSSFDLVAFRRAVESVRRRSVLNALAILCWCAKFFTEDTDVQRRQIEWRQDRKKWLEVFPTGIRDEFFQACAVPPGSPFPSELAEVGRFLNWFCEGEAGQGQPLPPDFAKVLAELETQFGMHL